MRHTHRRQKRARQSHHAYDRSRKALTNQASLTLSNAIPPVTPEGYVQAPAILSANHPCFPGSTRCRPRASLNLSLSSMGGPTCKKTSKTSYISLLHRQFILFSFY